MANNQQDPLIKTIQIKCSVMKVLMWKHFTVRKRRYVHTIVEFSTPVFFFAIMFAFKGVFMPTSSSASKYAETTGVRNTEPFTLNKTSLPSRIFYYPNDYLPGLLMDQLGKEMRSVRLPDLDGPNQWRKGYYGFTNESEITEKTVVQQNDAVVIFHNLKGSEWPTTLNYTIRIRYDYGTEDVEPRSGRLEPHRAYGDIYDSFMKLQWAIDTTFIDIATKHPITQNLTLQEFPYYKSVDNDFIELLCVMFNFICPMSLILVFVFLVSRLLEERSSGIQELIKMVGVSSNALGVSHFLNVLPAGLVYSIVGTLLLKVSATPLVPHSNGVLIFIMLLLHFVSLIAMAFACSYLAKGTQHSIAIAFMGYAFLASPALLVSKYELPRLLVYLTGILPHQPVYWFWNEVAASEKFGQGLSIGTLLKTFDPKNVCVLFVYGMLIVQALIFFGLTWYLNLVRPGKYGQALPWLFMFQRGFWSKNDVLPDDAESETELINISPGNSSEDQKFFEKADPGLEVGIKVLNVSKVFPNHQALDKVSLDVYKNEITVLLGHNGAGKTTLMSIITGMIPPTRGSVHVDGLSTESQVHEVRRHLGLCPQHNLFFSDLTVLEHVMFFTLLKGTTFQKARESSWTQLADLGLQGKENYKCSELSGGMKRRLQLACALAGDADVLVLDEPTSGLDVETRRNLWDLLLGLRGSRTVLVSTHFMEEAEALGDRVAALHRGRLACHATPMHLKRAIGTGYRLTLTTEGVPMEAKVTALVTSHIPSATIKDQTLNSLTYSLPSSESKSFEKLFSHLEDKRYELKINSMGVGISTLEEVFLKLCSDVDHTWKDASKNGHASPEITPKYVKCTGMKLYWRQLFVLLKRQAIYIMRNKYAFLIMQAFLPILCLLGLTYMANNDATTSVVSNSPLTLDLDAYRQRGVRVIYNATDVTPLLQRYPDVEFEHVPDVYDALLYYAKTDVWDYNKYVIGIEFNETDAKVWYTTILRHAAPVALSALSNMLANTFASTPDARVDAISTTNWPLFNQRQTSAQYVNAKDKISAMIWAVSCIFVVLTSLAGRAWLVCKERGWGSRHGARLAGAAPELCWAAALLAHAALALLLQAAPLLLAPVLLERDHTLDQPRFLGSLLLITMVGCLAFYSFMYLVSFWMNERSANGFLAAYLIVFSFITPLIATVSEYGETSSLAVQIIMQAALYATPPHALVRGAVRGARAARLDALCRLNQRHCPRLNLQEDGLDDSACCEGTGYMCYLCFDDNGAGKELVILAVQFVVFMSCVLLISRGVMSAAWERLVNARYCAPPAPAAAPAAPAAPAAAPDTVRAAAEYVSHAIGLAPSRQDAMLVHDVHKKYVRLFKKSVNAVRGVSFAVKKGECFGLLGVNGAGKSTTFKMLTAEECPTRGRIYANGYHQDKNREQYLRTLGYCPQFNGLDKFLTGEENLELLLTISGLNAEDTRKETDTWLEILGLQHIRHRPLETYSGGSARRLGAGAALAAGGALVLLDEPTAGVDVAARRRLWAAVTRARDQGRSLLLSSHSMDETEALCSTIGIMSLGRLRALGSAPELRAAHAAGHAVLLQLRRAQPDQVDSSKSRIDELKTALKNTFVGTIKDEHQTMLRYHINDPMRYSELFEKLEQLKQQYQGLLEDYSVTETTLEEVFLTFAKESHAAAV